MSANTVERLNVFHFLDYTIWKLFQVGIWEPFTHASDVDERDDDEEISVT